MRPDFIAMKNLFEAPAVEEVLARIDRLQPTSQRQWGKMDVAQMLAHLGNTMDMASGRLKTQRVFIGRLIGPMFKSLMTNDKPFGRNAPTSGELKIADARDFAREQQRLKNCIAAFHQGGEAACTRVPHPFFGPLTPVEWSTGMYKHIDHHLRQFGV